MSFLRRYPLMLIGLLAGTLVTWFVTHNLFGGSAEKMTSTATWENILLVNVLVGACILLFVVELRRQAIRVLLTVVVALILGFLVTFIFNLDAADRFTRGEFRAQVVSEAEPVDHDDVDLSYNRVRGGEFNKPNVVEPVERGRLDFRRQRGRCRIAAGLRQESALDRRCHGRAARRQWRGTGSRDLGDRIASRRDL